MDSDLGIVEYLRPRELAGESPAVATPAGPSGLAALLRAALVRGPALRALQSWQVGCMLAKWRTPSGSSMEHPSSSVTARSTTSSPYWQSRTPFSR
jgi:hypothetical protein